MKTKNLFGGTGILKFKDYKGMPYTIKSADIKADEQGRKIVPAGTPLPSVSAVKGLLLEDADVTYGDEAVTIVYQATVDNAKLAKKGVTLSDTVKKALPRITFVD